VGASGADLVAARRYRLVALILASATVAGAESPPSASARRAAKRSGIERHYRPPAVDLQTMRTRLDGDRAYVEGTVANGAPFAVYNVWVCIKGNCDYATPPTLQPGSQATFRVPARLEHYVAGPDYRITWDVMTAAE